MDKKKIQQTTYIDPNTELAFAYLPRIEDALAQMETKTQTMINQLQKTTNDIYASFKNTIDDINAKVDDLASYILDISKVIQNTYREEIDFLNDKSKEIASKIRTLETTIITTDNNILENKKALAQLTNTLDNLQKSIQSTQSVFISFQKDLEKQRKTMQDDLSNILATERENMKKIFYLTIATNITTICLAIFLAYEVLKKI